MLFAELSLATPLKERRNTSDLLREQGDRLLSDRSLTRDLLSQAPDIKIPTKLDSNEVGAWFFVANALLNLDETITKG